MEEDLKVLEEYLSHTHCFQCIAENGLCPDCYIDIQQIQAIENLIKRNKEVEEKANKLGKLYYEVNENCIKYEKDYIPKSKVREIIQDIDNSQPVIAELKLRKLVEGDK